ncbi:unnamed protein product [Soybean chlorotic mottle virus]|uniref:Uncharacterized protein 8 n=1 Tax=Soybean chlorotic mottle virus TaxID=10651 RepID=Y8_SOCMV|nr:hypothetical protein SbCMVgp5 [Soybean chlorotic mottle virus]P15635.1 RecName: Full=Uncharacterized protein 8 [Soybean chlorotic mottle virus]CAA33829.1 unnamed protein product [Soybean chlorotic mottle virus]
MDVGNQILEPKNLKRNSGKLRNILKRISGNGIIKERKRRLGKNAPLENSKLVQQVKRNVNVGYATKKDTMRMSAQKRTTKRLKP